MRLGAFLAIGFALLALVPGAEASDDDDSGPACVQASSWGSASVDPDTCLDIVESEIQRLLTDL